VRDYHHKKKRKAGSKHKKKRRPAFDLSGAIKSCIRISLSVVAILVASASLYGGWIYITTDSRFDIAAIEVEGNEKVSKDEILRAAGMGQAKNIFTYNVRAAGREIEGMPWVKKVTIERRLPDTLSIQVIERQPVALIKLGKFYYFDAEGNIFAEADSTTGWNFPVLSGIDKEKLLEGDEATFGKVTEGIALLELMKGQGRYLSWSNVSELVFSKDAGITIYPSGGAAPVCLGRKNLALRLAQAERVLADLDAKGINAARVQADYDDRVYVRKVI
jgi:cell division septal protein FtsQ